MSLHHALACEPPASRRLRWLAPLLVVAGLTMLALAPGLIAGDRPFETSLCGHVEDAAATCAQLERTASAAVPAVEAN